MQSKVKLGTMGANILFFNVPLEYFCLIFKKNNKYN